MMKRTLMAVALAALLGAANAPAQVFTGDTRLSCEALLCLSSGVRPEQCLPSLTRYFGIRRLRARRDFLNLCPVSQQSAAMRSLAVALAEGAGRCDAPFLNATLGYTTVGPDGREVVAIGNTWPGYCAAMYGHAYSGYQSTLTLPVYVGLPERGGFWVEQWDYERALAEYTARVAAEDTARAASGWWWN
jgi:hypothetical protein